MSQTVELSRRDWLKTAAGVTAALVTPTGPPGDAQVQNLSSEKAGAIAIGTRKQLFVDDYIVAERKGLRRVVNQFEKHPANPLLKVDKPWEGQRLVEYTLLYDEEDKLFKCWYPAQTIYYDKPATSVLCYATSADGVNWDKPKLGLQAFEGQDTNIVLVQRPRGFNNPFLVKDLHENDLARRYKWLIRGEEGYFSLAYSADGLRWTPTTVRTNMKYVDDPPYLQFDQQQGVFTFYRRFWTKSHDVVGGGHQWGWPGDRAIGLAMSRDLVYWQPNNTLILRADEEDQRWAKANGGLHIDLHAMRGFPYEGLWLGFVERDNIIFPALLGEDGRAIPGSNDDSYRQHALAYSRDGYAWHRLAERTSLIPLGKPGQWDGADLGYPCSRPIIRGDEVWVYYRGVNCTKYCLSWYGDVEKTEAVAKSDANYYRQWKSLHNHAWNAKTSSIGLATIRLDGFVSLDANGEEGILLTQPMIAGGTKLVINAKLYSFTFS